VGLLLPADSEVVPQALTCCCRGTGSSPLETRLSPRAGSPASGSLTSDFTRFRVTGERNMAIEEQGSPPPLLGCLEGDVQHQVLRFMALAELAKLCGVNKGIRRLLEDADGAWRAALNSHTCAQYGVAQLSDARPGCTLLFSQPQPRNLLHPASGVILTELWKHR
jgi:hypothetical protein